jgi:hypothetical protein
MDMDFENKNTEKDYMEYEYNENNIHELVARINELKKAMENEDNIAKKEELSCELLALKDKYDEIMGISSFKGR